MHIYIKVCIHIHSHIYSYIQLEKTAEDENVEVRIVNVGSRLEKNAMPNKTGDYSYIGIYTCIYLYVYVYMYL
jgi:hypothetical protein